MARSPSSEVRQWDAFVAALLALLAATAFLGWRLGSPSECAWLPPQAEAFRADGVVPRTGVGCDLPRESVVSGAVIDDGRVRYTLQPGDQVVDLRVGIDRGALALRLWEAGGTLLFVVSLFGLCGYAVSRRPHDPAAGSNLVYSAALLGSTVVTVVGLPPSSAFAGPSRWLFAFNVGFVYTVAWGAMLAWALQFPSPLSPRLSGLRTRLLVTWLPALVWAAVAIAAGTGRDFPAWMAQAIPVQTLITIGCLGLVLGLLGFRLVRAHRPGSDPVQRQQLVWLGGSGLVAGLLALAFWIVPSLLTGQALLPDDLIGLPGLVYVVGLSIAMLRYRLFDLDAVLARTLVYASLTLAAVLVYLGTVGLLSGLVAAGQSTGVAVVGAVAVAIAVNPLRVALERAVNRALYGDRDDPYRALSRLAGHLAAREVVWTEVADDLSRALRVPFVAIQTGSGTIVEAGVKPAEPNRLATEPLVHAGIDLGRLVVGARGHGERFAPAERRLLADLAVQVASAVHAESLDGEVQASRERLVLGREEERRRLRRTLHDEVGPTMAAIALRADTVRRLLVRPHAADEVDVVLDRIEEDASQAADAVRRLAYDLRPPALDDRGLAEALREHVAGLAPMHVVLDTRSLDTGGAAPLSAAVEVAAYRIVTGALANAVRHGGAGTCWVTLSRTANSLTVTVADNGAGPPADLRAGVGLSSMRERAAELGGQFSIGPRPGGGTLVASVLPVGGPL